VFFKLQENVFILKTSNAMHFGHPVFQGAPTILPANSESKIGANVKVNIKSGIEKYLFFTCTAWR
jgi:hypothetical protein